jgi:hypothetical protein
VDVIVEGTSGTANVLVPVGSVATGRLEMSGALAVLLVALGALLSAGLVNIVYKSAGEGLLPVGAELAPLHRSRARRVAMLSVPVLGLLLLGGARWWQAVDRNYQETLYRPSPLVVSNDAGRLRIALGDTVFQRGVSPLVSDHGKLMHLFLVRQDDAHAFAHLHPRPVDTSAVPGFETRVPPLPAGDYHAFGDVVHETGFERTLVGTLTLGEPGRAAFAPADPDDAWFIGEASREGMVRLDDGLHMRMTMEPAGLIEAGREVTIRVAVIDAAGAPARLEPYLGMVAHAVVLRVDGSVYVHLHPMGTVTAAAQRVFHARDRGDTTSNGRIRLADHAMHGSVPAESVEGTVEFPYAFPRGGSYRVFVQVRRGGRILTGAFALTVAESPERRR